LLRFLPLGELLFLACEFIQRKAAHTAC